jgi:hypothetical protein
MSPRCNVGPIARVCLNVCCPAADCRNADRVSSKDEEALTTQIQDLSTVDEKYVRELSTRLCYINALRRRGLRRGMREAIKTALPEVTASLGHDRSDGNIHAVISGNAKRQQPRRLLPVVEAVLKQTIKAEYCNRQRKSLVHVQLMALRQLQSMAQKGEIPEEAASVGATTIARRVRDDNAPDEALEVSAWIARELEEHRGGQSIQAAPCPAGPWSVLGAGLSLDGGMRLLYAAGLRRDAGHRVGPGEARAGLTTLECRDACVRGVARMERIHRGTASDRAV